MLLHAYHWLSSVLTLTFWPDDLSTVYPETRVWLTELAGVHTHQQHALQQVRNVFLNLGTDYESILIMPELQSATRGLTSEVATV